MRSTSSEPGEEERETFLQDEASPWEQTKSHGALRNLFSKWWRTGFEAVLVIAIVALLFSRELASHVGSNNNNISNGSAGKDFDTSRTPVPACEYLRHHAIYRHGSLLTKCTIQSHANR